MDLSAVDCWALKCPLPRSGGGKPVEYTHLIASGTTAPHGRGSAVMLLLSSRGDRGNPARAGVNHTEGQVFQYTIDLTKKRKKRKPPDRREKKAPAKAIAKMQPTKPAPSRTPEEIAAAGEKRRERRREYDQKRSKNPDRMEQGRLNAQARRQIAKATGKCKSCPEPAIPGQTRCPNCSEQHRQSRRRSDARRRTLAKTIETS